MKFPLYKWRIFCYNQATVLNLARWCSRLARQPVTLEVDGSSPFRVAKTHLLLQVRFLFLKNLPSECFRGEKY